MDEKQIDQIVAMIDQFMGENGGHMNITVQENSGGAGGPPYTKTVTQMKSAGCAPGNLACNAPTLFEGLDGQEGQ